MNPAIADLEPAALWRHFAALAAIPRGSGNEAGARQYVLDCAARLGLAAATDAVGNVIVRKPARAGREAAVPSVLQGHLDMVCEKNEATTHDFDRDPIELVRDGDWIRADGTTLGADNGIGVAAMLAVMESTAVAHGRLEFVFTIDEENGLTGASGLAPGSLAGKYFFNLDSEEENQLCIGCAGGVNTVARRYLTLAPAPAGRAFRLRVTGLQGGHSGIDIHKGRGNAIRLLARVLHAAIEDCGVAVAGLNGGSKRNAIPREAAALVVVDPPRERALRELLAACQAVFRSELGAFDPQVELSLEATAAPAEVIAPAEAALVANLLAAQHHGVLAMSPDVAGLVQTSTNLAIVATNGAEIVVETSQRSPIEASKAAAAGMVSTVFHQAGFATEQNASYPGWKPEPHSDIVRLAVAVHKELLGIEPELVAIHAGLECGVIGEKHPGMQMISFGPRLTDVHSPSERVKISTVPPFWKYLTGLLERV